MIDFTKINRLPYMSKRMFIIKNICAKKNVDVEYLFGLFNIYNNKNSGKWFWQKAQFTGALKQSYEKFNNVADEIVKDLKYADNSKTEAQMESAAEVLESLMAGIEQNCEVNRETDQSYIKGLLDNNMKALITDSLRKTG